MHEKATEGTELPTSRASGLADLYFQTSFVGQEKKITSFARDENESMPCKYVLLKRRFDYFLFR